MFVINIHDYFTKQWKINLGIREPSEPIRRQRNGTNKTWSKDLKGAIKTSNGKKNMNI